MKEIIEQGATSVFRRVFIGDASSANGDGKTGLSHATAGLEIFLLPSGNGGPTVCKVSNGTIESVAAVGTYQAPSQSNRIRFAEVDAVGAPGVYELHFRNELFAAGRGLVGGVRGVAAALVCPFELQLSDAVRGVGSPTALPNAAAGASGGLPTASTVAPDGLTLAAKVNLTAATQRGIWDVLTSATAWAAGSFAKLLIQRLGWLRNAAAAGSVGTVVRGGDVEFYVGEDCLASLGRSFDFELELPFDATACTWQIGIGPPKGENVLTKTGTVELIEGDTYRIRFEPGAADTGAAAVLAYQEYGYTVTSETGDGEISPRVEGVATTRRMWRAAA